MIVSLFLANGATALILSTLINSGVLALIGLGLVFWGALLIYIEPRKYVPISLLNSTSIPLLEIIEQITSALNYKGTGVYLPPRYFSEPSNEKIFINWSNYHYIPRLGEIREDAILQDKPTGLFIIPPGLSLTNLYEQEMRVNFSKIDINYLKNSLPNLFTERLEIAKNLEIDTVDDTVHIKLTDHIYKDICSQWHIKHGRSFCCPLCSSIALALTRTSNNPVIIEQIETSQEGNVLEVRYKICGNTK